MVETACGHDPHLLESRALHVHVAAYLDTARPRLRLRLCCACRRVVIRKEAHLHGAACAGAVAARKIHAADALDH